jgi:uncharacterized protein
MIALPGTFMPRNRSVWAAFISGLFALLLAAVAVAAPNFPALNGTRVIDQAGLLKPETRTDLDLKLKGLEDKTTDQVVVVTLNSLDGYEIEDYGYQLGRYWGIGQKNVDGQGTVTASNGEAYKDNGILLIVAPNERKVRIEVGYGLEPVMTDALSSQIIRGTILPAFKSGDYEGGIVAGTDKIIEQLSLDRGVAIQKAQAAQMAAQQSPDRIPGWAILIIVLFFVFFSRGWLPWFILGNILGSGGRGGGDWGGGGGWSGGGGGGFSGGGGSFGGGGSSGSW